MARKSVINSVLMQRDFLAVFVVIVNAFSWYFPLYLFFDSILRSFEVESTFLLVTFGVHYVAAVGSAIVGTTLMKRFPSRETFLSVWMFIGVIASALIVTLGTFNTTYVFLVSFLLGVSLGFGFPSSLSYFGDYSIEENRGRLAGITFFASNLCVFIVSLLLSFSTLFIGGLILAAWRGIGLFLFLLTRPKQDYPKEDTIAVSYRSVLFDRPFLLYLIPWVMFSLINFLEAPIVTIFFGDAFASLIIITEFGIGSFAALIGGWFSDSVGRKRVIISGFIMLGIGYAVLGLFPNLVLCWYLYIILDGVAWGLFLLMFYLVLWAELAGNRTKEKYYLIGTLPFIISSYIQILFTPYAKLINISTAFSLASFFLFLAVFPILLAPETLPEKKIELKRLRKYVDKAKEIRGTYEEKESV